jgi:NTE family protein
MQAVDTQAALSEIAVFSGLGLEERLRLAAAAEAVAVSRGEVLIRQGADADALYIVVSGRFVVTRDGSQHPVAEIGPGQPIGEIAFLSGCKRTATVTALRDSLVQRLSREDFDAIVARDPKIWQSLTTTLARRLAETTAATAPPPDPKPRTVAIIRAGGSDIPNGFIERFQKALGAKVRTLVVTPLSAANVLGTAVYNSAKATEALNALESSYDVTVLVADHSLTPWSEKVIHHADLVLAVGLHTADAQENALERVAAVLLPSDARRLVLTHATQSRVTGTARWLDGRQVGMHHHVALNGDADFSRLVRFIMGEARGLVACGGGAWCAAHVGIYRGLKHLGYDYDMMGGTSGGSAMTAAFLMEADLEAIQQSIHAMFVERKAMRRLTLPRFSLMDHARFDYELQRLYGDTDIEDLWLPYFAVSTNLSRYKIHVHRRGPVWKAIRASASVPVIFPPVYIDDGEMLVDGCVLDNVPLKTMHALKSGPNTVISFMVPEIERFDVAFNSLPTRQELLWMTLSPWRRSKIPEAPSLINVLMRSLMANRHAFQSSMTADDQLLVPALPAGITLLDWHRHPDLIASGYQWTMNNVGTAR